MINNFTKKEFIKQKELCPFCNNNLYDKDCEQYDFTCLNCDEGFWKKDLKQNNRLLK